MNLHKAGVDPFGAEGFEGPEASERNPPKKKKKAKSWAPNCTFSLESTGAGNLGLGLTKKKREVSNRKLEISRTLRTLRVHLAFLRLKALMNGLGVSSRKDGKLRPLQFAEVEA